MLLVVIPMSVIFFILWACLRCASIADEEMEKLLINRNIS